MTQAEAPLIVTVDPTGAVHGLRVATDAYSQFNKTVKPQIKDVGDQFDKLGHSPSIGTNLTKSSGLFNSFFSLVKSGMQTLANAVSDIFSKVISAVSISELVDAQVTMQKFAVTLGVVQGGATAAKSELDWLLATSNKLGVSFEMAVEPFAKFAASAAGSLNNDQIRKVFTSFAEASSALHLSGNEIKGVFLALQQMASKGVLSMEELRLQLAERIPGAMPLAAKAMNMTMTEFEKAVRDKTINIAEFFDKFSDALHNKFGAAAEESSKMLKASLERMANSWLVTKNVFFEGGFSEAFKSMIDDVTKWVNENKESIKKLGETVGKVFKTIVEEVPVAVQSLKDFSDSFATWDQIVTVIGSVGSAIWNLLKSVQGFAAVSSGRLSFIDFMKMDAEELDAWLKRSITDTGKLETEIDKVTKAMGRERSTLVYSPSARKDRADRIQSLDEELSRLQGLQKEQKKAAMQPILNVYSSNTLERSKFNFQDEFLEIPGSQSRATTASKEMEKLSKKWVDVRRDLEEEINLSPLDGLAKKLQVVSDKAAEYHRTYDKVGGKTIIDEWEAASRAALELADSTDQIKKATEKYNDMIADTLPKEEQAVAKITAEYVKKNQAIEEALRLNIINPEVAKLNKSGLDESQANDNFEALKKIEDQAFETGTEIEKLETTGSKAAKTLAEAFSGWASNMSKDLNDMLWSAKLTFTGLLEAFGKMITQMIIQKSIAEPLLGAAGNFLESLFATSITTMPGMSQVSAYDSMVGTGSTFSMVDNIAPSYLNALPSYDVGTDYVPYDMVAKIHKGEKIVPADQNNGGGTSVTVNLIESPGNGGKVERRQDNNGGNVLDVFVEQIKGAIAGDIARGDGAIPAAMGRTYGLNRVAGAY